MGRSPACDCRCGDDPPEPPVTDCTNLLCVVLMDENTPFGPNLLLRDARMQGFIDAFPNRVLIVLDVQRTSPLMIYTQNFIDHPRAFSLRLEYEDDPTDLIRFMERDAGRLSVAQTNDPWERIKTILARNGLTDWLNNDNSEVSIFVDSSGSVTSADVAATVDKLETDLEVDGKTRIESIYNREEDIICPFVFSECCTGQAAADLAALCGYTWDCPELVEIEFFMPPSFANNYYVRVDGQIYASSSPSYSNVIIRHVGEVETVEFVSQTVCPAGFPHPRQWKVKPSGQIGFTGVGNLLSPLKFTVPAGGMQIYPDVRCIFA